MEQVRAAYRRAACEHHPDVQGGENPAAEQKLRELIVAYKFLARRLDPAAWARSADRKTYTPPELARKGFQQTGDAEDLLDIEETPGRLAGLRSGQARPTRDETRTFFWLWAMAVAGGIVFGGAFGVWRMHSLGVRELPPGEVALTTLLALGLYVLLAAGAVLLVLLTRRIIRVTIRLGSRWLFLPGPNSDRTLPEPAKKIEPVARSARR